MRLVEARQAINQQMDILDSRRRKIHQLLEQHDITGGNKADRLELSKELDTLDKAYEETFQARERINEISMAIHNAEVSRQQAEAEANANEELMKCLEIFRRIANGDRVPASDEQKLMNYDSTMYMTAKSMSVIHINEKHKEHDSLWTEEESSEESTDPRELAENAEVSLSMPEIPAASAGVTGSVE